MHTKAHPHSHLFGVNLNPAKVTLAALLTLLFLIFLIPLMNIIAVPGQAQNSAPPTARQAANMPQYAGRLAHVVRPASPYNASPAARPTDPRASWKNPVDSRLRNRRGGPLDDTILYENGPINGTTDAWTINSGFVVSDTITVPSGGGTVNGLTFGAWLEPGDVLQTVEISITSSEFGGTSYSDQVINFTQSGCSGNQYGFNICTETSANFTGPNLAAGIYWVNLQNAVVNNGDPIYWDENSGVGCDSPGCPSLASANSVGTIPSEAFTILGNATTSTNCAGTCGPGCAHDTDNFDIIYNFSQNQSPAAGLAIDQWDKLYGLVQSGFGSAYQLALHAESWIFTPLYTFLGGANGQNPGTQVVGPDGAPYGIADGGFQNCGSSGNQYCGLIYRLRTSPSVCLTSLCSWTEDVVYQFRGTPDGWSPDGNLVFDQEGRLYGTTWFGGAYDQGTVYELTASTGGWSERVIYNFMGGSDGAHPGRLLFGHDGYLYGSSTAGVFRLIASGANWGFTLLAGWPNGPCSGLVQDNSGSFYCFDSYIQDQNNRWGEIWQLSHGDRWIWTQVENNYYDWDCTFAPCYSAYNSLAVSPAGRVYATSGAQYHTYSQQCGYIFYCDGSIHQVDGPTLVDFNGDVFRDLEIAPNGNFYGTTGACQASQGTAWQLNP